MIEIQTGEGRGRGGKTPSVRWTSPPNTTSQIWVANWAVESSDLPTGCYARGDSAMGIFLQTCIIHPSSFTLAQNASAG